MWVNHCVLGNKHNDKRNKGFQMKSPALSLYKHLIEKASIKEQNI